ncbi:MAG: membrane protein insertion efficiency factor YidD [Clostridia bacterium]|nr:membrane protein insertion efficiency factor YidD [Clostridia bacterium]
MRKRLRAVWILPIRAYQKFISPLLPSRCKFYPTCSAYACTAILRFGILIGGGLAVWRILRCNPWSMGGYYPVPQRDQLFKRRK